MFNTIALVLTMIPFSLNATDGFPVSVRGWTLAATAAQYNPANLHEYIDGASELYISFGFKELITRRYERPDQPEIIVDLFDMDRPANAFGIFAHSQEQPESGLGQDSEYLDGLLRFWKGRFYVSLLCSPETPESRLAVMDLGRQLAERLPDVSGRPAILSLLPQSGLLTGSIRFFQHHAWQNTYVFIASANILKLGPGCEAVLAKYEANGERPVVLLVSYPDPAAARQAFAVLCRRFAFPGGENRAVRLADAKYFAAAIEERIVAAVWHGGGPEDALALLGAMREKLRPASLDLNWRQP